MGVEVPKDEWEIARRGRESIWRLNQKGRMMRGVGWMVKDSSVKRAEKVQIRCCSKKGKPGKGELGGAETGRNGRGEAHHSLTKGGVCEKRRGLPQKGQLQRQCLMTGSRYLRARSWRERVTKRWWMAEICLEMEWVLMWEIRSTLFQKSCV